MNSKVAFQIELRRRGINPADAHKLTRQEYHSAAKASRDKLRLARAGVSVLVTAGTVALLGDARPETVEARERKCATECPRRAFRTLADGQPACDECQCSGKLLQLKWRNPKAACPLPENERPWGPEDETC